MSSQKQFLSESVGLRNEILHKPSLMIFAIHGKSMVTET